MSQETIGKKVPDSELHLTGNKHTRISDFQGKTLVLYFYPKASTPGCTVTGYCDRSGAR